LHFLEVLCDILCEFKKIPSVFFPLALQRKHIQLQGLQFEYFSVVRTGNCPFLHGTNDSFHKSVPFAPTSTPTPTPPASE
jgi:hypothetical protein